MQIFDKYDKQFDIVEKTLVQYTWNYFQKAGIEVIGEVPLTRKDFVAQIRRVSKEIVNDIRLHLDIKVKEALALRRQRRRRNGIGRLLTLKHLF
jgi:hypothetical protein